MSWPLFTELFYFSLMNKHQRLWANASNLCSHEQTDRWADLLTDYQQVSQPNGGEQFLII